MTQRSTLIYEFSNLHEIYHPIQHVTEILSV